MNGRAHRGLCLPPSVLLVASCLLAGAAEAQEAAEVLANVRAAAGLAGLARHPDGIRMAAEELVDGTAAPTEYLFDARGRFVVEQGGRLPSKAAFDGATGWVRDRGGETRVLEWGDLAVLRTRVGILSGLPLTEGALPFEVDPRSSTEQLVVLLASIDGKRTVIGVRIDRGTWRVRDWEVVTGGDRMRFVPEGEVEFDGIRFPRMVRLGGAGSSDTITVTGVDVAAPDESRYRYLPQRPADATFDAGTPPVVRGKKTRDGRLLVEARIDGRDPGWYLFDTGASQNFVDAKAPAAAGLVPLGEFTVPGIGGAVRARAARAGTLTIGPLTIHEPLLFVGDMNLDYLGENVVGVLGYPVLARGVVEMDIEGASVALLDPEKYTLPKGAWMPIHLHHSMPIINGEFEGRPGVFEIDSGGVDIVFGEPTVRVLRLTEGRKLEPVEIQGAGGRMTLKSGRVRTFGLGAYVGRDVPAQFATDPRGPFGDTYTDASVGTAMLRSYVIVWDYFGRRAAVVAREEWVKEGRK